MPINTQSFIEATNQMMRELYGSAAATQLLRSENSDTFYIGHLYIRPIKPNPWLTGYNLLYDFSPIEVADRTIQFDTEWV